MHKQIIDYSGGRESPVDRLLEFLLLQKLEYEEHQFSAQRGHFLCSPLNSAQISNRGPKQNHAKHRKHFQKTKNTENERENAEN